MAQSWNPCGYPGSASQTLTEVLTVGLEARALGHEQVSDATTFRMAFQGMAFQAKDPGEPRVELQVWLFKQSRLSPNSNSKS